MSLKFVQQCQYRVLIYCEFENVINPCIEYWNSIFFQFQVSFQYRVTWYYAWYWSWQHYTAAMRDILSGSSSGSLLSELAMPQYYQRWWTGLNAGILSWNHNILVLSGLSFSWCLDTHSAMSARQNSHLCLHLWDGDNDKNCDHLVMVFRPYTSLNGCP